jgi:hypothetical protein
VPLFTLDNDSAFELGRAFALADRLSECVAFQRLCEAPSATDARQRIVVGLYDDDEQPRDRDELDEGFVWVRICDDEEGGHTLRKTIAVDGCPDEGGRLTIRIRRQVRDSEQLNDAYLWMWNCVSKFSHQLLESATNAQIADPLIASIDRRIGVHQATQGQEAAQGRFLVAELVVAWGDGGDS